MSKNRLSPELLALLADLKPEPPQPKPKPPLTLAASSEGKPDEAVASVPLEGEDLERVKGALAGRRTMVNGDEVGFDKVCHARVTMRWCKPTAAHQPSVISGYNPFSLDRLPGYDPDDQ